MDALLKSKWIVALRSGKYAQTRRTLRDANGYCCLGVLCDVIGNNDLIHIEDDHIATLNEDEDDPEYSHDELTHDLCNRIGLGTLTMKSLASRNDGTGEFESKPQSFEEIADFLESSPDI